MPWPEPSSAARSSLRRKSANARAAGFMVFPLAKSAFTSIERQSGSTRTSFPASSSAHALFLLGAAIPSPATALAVAPSLIVIARVELPTPARRAIARAQAPTASRSNVIAWRTQRGDVSLLRSAVQLCRLRPLDDSSSKRWSLGYPRDHPMPPGRLRHASGAPPARSFCSIASVIISAIVSLVTRPTNCLPRPVTATVAAEFCCINLSACSKVARRPTVRTDDAVMVSATGASGPACFTD